MEGLVSGCGATLRLTSWIAFVMAAVMLARGRGETLLLRAVLFALLDAAAEDAGAEAIEENAAD